MFRFVVVWFVLVHFPRYSFSFPKKLFRAGLTWVFSISARWRSAASCSAVSVRGTSTLTCTSRWPRPWCRGSGMPWPFSVKTSPLCVPGGIRNSLQPSSDGTSIVAPKRRLRVADRRLAIQVLSSALKQRMLLHVDEAVAVAGRTAVGAGLAFSLQTQPGAIVDAGRNVDLARDDLLARSPSRGSRRTPRGSPGRGRGRRGRWFAARRCRFAGPRGRGRRSSGRARAACPAWPPSRRTFRRPHAAGNGPIFTAPWAASIKSSVTSQRMSAPFCTRRRALGRRRKYRRKIPGRECRRRR